MALTIDLRLIHVPFPPEWGRGQATNVYLLRDSRILIDAGFDSQSNREYIKKALKEQRSWNIEKILITHGHLDHFGLSAYIQQELGAEILIHQEDAKALKDYKTTLNWFDEAYELALEGGYSEEELISARMQLFAAIEVMSRPSGFETFKKLEIPLREKGHSEGDQTAKEGKETITSVDLPGHTPGCAGFAIGKTVFSGDVAIESSTAVGELRKEFESLESLKTFDLIYPGHGRAPITPKEIADLEAHFRKRLQQVTEITKEGRNLKQIVNSLYPVPDGGANFMRRVIPIRQVLSYLRYLEEEGRVEKKGSVWSSSLT